MKKLLISRLFSIALFHLNKKKFCFKKSKKVKSIFLLQTHAVFNSQLSFKNLGLLVLDEEHRFGVKQKEKLFQLKGRVGRSAKQAYCYLIYPEKQRLSSLAKERLKFLKKYVDLGSSFQLALQDLENRGAGSLFGSEQSGHIQDLGEEFYFEILNEQLKKQEEVFIEPGNSTSCFSGDSLNLYS